MSELIDLNELIIISKEFSFEAGHYLLNYKGKCANKHGHSYKLIVNILGNTDETGMVIDFDIITKIVKRNIIRKLDHKSLNEVFVNPIMNPTAENIARWIYLTLNNIIEKIRLFGNSKYYLYSITLYETATSSVTYCPDLFKSGGKFKWG